tara:strand:- start:357783 stop:359171 length:1389 start_codon:yes stop_codon:yes gene_type:complete
MNTGSLIGAAFVAVSSFMVCTAYAENPVEAAVHKHIEPLIEAGLVPGAVVGVRYKGIDSYFTLGTLAFDGDEEPSFDTLYEIGSISKVMTGILLADAIRRGEVTKGTLVDELLPEGVDSKDFKGTEVALWHLTTHSSGWPTAPSNLRPTDPDKPFMGYTEEMMYEYISKVKPMREPGTEFEYSNLGVGLLGTLLAHNADSDYETIVTERVFKPLGIEDIQITLSDKDLHRLAPATSSGRSTKAWGDIGPFNAAGMWVASAPAMLEFATANLSDEDGEIFESLEASREPVIEGGFDSGFGTVCYGWMLAKDGSSYWHNGMTGGYSSYLAVNLDLGAAVVVLTNGATLNTTAAGEKLFQQIVGMNPEPIQLAKYDPIDKDYAQRLVGEYKGEYFTMYVTSEAGKLFARITGQQALVVLETDKANTFRYELVDAEIEFELPEEGNATTVTLLQNGQVLPCTRLED